MKAKVTNLSPDIANFDRAAGPDILCRRGLNPGGRFGLARFGRAPLKPARQDPDADAYLLVLLADQELAAGRDEQAQFLVDAAYASFDRQMRISAGFTSP
jgi:hypothetical protein